MKIIIVELSYSIPEFCIQQLFDLWIIRIKTELMARKLFMKRDMHGKRGLLIVVMTGTLRIS